MDVPSFQQPYSPLQQFVRLSMAAKGFSEASSSGFKWNHDVFLSFRGEDTRKNFTDHLYAALVRDGVVTFRDDDELPRGNDISSELLKAIEESKLSIVVFSKNYASSRWCLDELVKIIECKNTTGQVVIPVFYDVDPSDVRKQIGSYEEAFAKHEDRFKDKMERIKKWREALTEAGNLSGWDLRNMANGYESRVIQKIVKDVIKKLNRNIRNGLHVTTHPVALESHVKRVMRLLDIGSEEVCVVGIYGMSGIGKTTIAKAVYNMVCEGFEGYSFLSNIKDDSQQPNGLARMQEQLLSDILNWKEIKIVNIDRGVNLIKERLCYGRVLIVLDDLDESAQWRPLVGDRKWFGRGSRVLVTTRDEHLLTELEVDERYKVEQLNHEESIQLLSWYAFRWPTPEKDYFELCNRLVEHAEGLPLALENFGSSLFKRSLPEWESFVEKLQKVPHHQIQKKLRISFDTLDDVLWKDIFLDIACFFVGMDKDFVMTILDGCGFFPKIGIKVLLERSLIAIDPHDQKLQMHKLLRDMGREIVREVSPSHPGYRSRLWFHQDVVDVLTKHMGMEAVEGLSLDVPALEDDPISTEAFAKMINLRLLKIDSVRFTGSYEKFSRKLRWLWWRRCPLMVLPPNLHLDNLVALEMRHSSIKKVWKETKDLHKLKILDLSYSVYLGETPNFARLSSLQRLELEGCTGLVGVDKSIGHLEKLEFLNLAECKNISELPDSICKLRSLETMNLNGCSKLCNLPEHLGKLEALRMLVLSGSAITELPTSIGLLKNLEHLSLAGLREKLPLKSCFSFFSSGISPKSSVGSSSLLLPATFSHFSSLRELNLCDLNLSDHEISIDFGSFRILSVLNLGGNKFCNLPAGISNHPRLLFLRLNNCKNLRSLTELPKNLITLEAKQCTSIERYPNLSNIGDQVHEIRISNYREVVDIQGWEFPSFHGRQWCDGWLVPDPNHPKKFFTSQWNYLEAYFPAREVADWFDYKEIGSSMLFCMPSIPIGLRRAMIVCVIYSVNEECNDESTSAASLTVSFKNKTKGCETVDRSDTFLDGNICQDPAWVSYMTPPIFIHELNAEEGDEIEVSIEPRGGILVKKFGMHLPIDTGLWSENQTEIISFQNMKLHQKQL